MGFSRSMVTKRSSILMLLPGEVCLFSSSGSPRAAGAWRAPRRGRMPWSRGWPILGVAVMRPGDVLREEVQRLNRCWFPLTEPPM